MLYNLVEGIVIGASLLEPFMPGSAQRIVDQLHTSLRGFDRLEEFGLYPSGSHVTEKPEILFARLDVKEIVEKADAMFAARQQGERSFEDEAENVIEIEAKPEIEYSDFDKLQFQVGEIIACEEVKKSKSCFAPGAGSEEIRQIVSGIKQHYTAEEMVGKKVMVLDQSEG